MVPEAGIILGTGLGSLGDDLEIVAVVPYREIPHFPISTVESHAGELVLGRLRNPPDPAQFALFSLRALEQAAN